MADPAIYPVSGGSEAIETALKLARATQLARGEPDRLVVFARWGSYHGNTLGALDLSGRRPLRRPYEAWLGRFRHVSAAYPYRGEDPGSQRAGHDAGAASTSWTRRSRWPGRGPSPRSSRSRSSGATLAAVEPPPGYWPAIADVCRRHGALLIADEVMTGFGRTGAWFGMTHFGVQPDLLVAAKGATSGYWPFGFVAASGEVYDTVTRRRAVRPRLHVLAPAGGRGGRPGGAADPRGGVAGRRVGDQGRTTARPCSTSGSDANPVGRRHPGPGPDGRRGAGAGPRDARAVCRELGELVETVVAHRARARAAALLGHRQRRTASTATRSCSGRRSWSPTRSWSGSPTAWPQAIDVAVASVEDGAAPDVIRSGTRAVSSAT